MRRGAEPAEAVSVAAAAVVPPLPPRPPRAPVGEGHQMATRPGNVGERGEAAPEPFQAFLAWTGGGFPARPAPAASSRARGSIAGSHRLFLGIDIVGAGLLLDGQQGYGVEL